jgi:hypothetical protein
MRESARAVQVLLRGLEPELQRDLDRERAVSPHALGLLVVTRPRPPDVTLFELRGSPGLLHAAYPVFGLQAIALRHAREVAHQLWERPPLDAVWCLLLQPDEARVVPFGSRVNSPAPSPRATDFLRLSAGPCLVLPRLLGCLRLAYAAEAARPTALVVVAVAHVPSLRAHGISPAFSPEGYAFGAAPLERVRAFAARVAPEVVDMLDASPPAAHVGCLFVGRDGAIVVAIPVHAG